ncbi:K(+)-transporting ATPase subunit F [Caldicoprobacter guelmensis]
MDVELIGGVVVSIGLLLYLVYALLKAEDL